MQRDGCQQRVDVGGLSTFAFFGSHGLGNGGKRGAARQQGGAQKELTLLCNTQRGAAAVVWLVSGVSNADANSLVLGSAEKSTNSPRRRTAWKCTAATLPFKIPSRKSSSILSFVFKFASSSNMLKSKIILTILQQQLTGVLRMSPPSVIATN